MGNYFGRYSLEPVAYRVYEYLPYDPDPFRYLTDDGLLIIPETMYTDGATTPRVLWSIPGFDPMDWIRAAIIHDWLYESHHRGQSDVTFEQANDILRIALKLEDLSEFKIDAIMLAVDQFGRKYWDRKIAENNPGEP